MEQDSQNTDSLFDFIYIDKQRVSSLIAQLFGAGVITSVKQTTSDSDKNNKSLELNVKIAKARIGFDETLTSSQERLFDAAWSLPLNLLDRLSEMDMIKNDLSGLKIGDIALATGLIKVFDVGMVHKLMPAAKLIARQNKNKNQIKKEQQELDTAEQILKVLPQSIQIDMATVEGRGVWMTVSPDHLTIPTGDLMLKYGPIIPGQWHVLGILDAHAHDLLETPEAPYPTSENEIRNSMDVVGMMIRMQIGRPSSSFGITPLMIFRKIK